MSDLRIGVVSWENGDGMAAAIRGTLAALGHTPIEISPDGRHPAGLDLIFMWGPLGSPLPTARSLLAAAPHDRPKFVLWQTEQAWNPAVPAWFAVPASRLRAWLDRQRIPAPEQPGRRSSGSLTRGARYRHFGDLLWLKRHGLPDVLAVPSDWYAGFLRRHGIPNFTAYIGAHPDWGADLGLERDIPVLWLGKPGSRRRIRILRQVREGLKRRGIRMMVVDGIEAPYVFGQERTELLNRTRIVLNVMRRPWDANAMRYYLAAANGAMVLTEPTLAHNPFIPGVHIAEADPPRLARTAVYYLENETARRRLVENARALVETELTMQRQIGRILAEVERS